jgi:histidinol-phosphate aminotransferase
MSVPHKEALDDLEPYKAAASLERVKRDFGLADIIKLAGNENMHGCSPKAKDAIRAMREDISFYPDTETIRLKEALSFKLGLEKNELLFGSGSFELLTLVSLAFLKAGAEALIPRPSFGWYYTATRAADADAVFIPLKDYALDLAAILGGINAKTRMIWLCNPNNPTGTYIGGAALEAFIKEVPGDVLILLDEAYIDFAPDDAPRAIELIRRYDNVITLRSFSKVYGLAGLRIGYAAGNAALIEKISRVRSPVNVNAAAQAAALAALTDEEFYRYVVNETRKGRDLYYRELPRLGIEYIPTTCNFIMFNTKRDSGDVERAYLKEGVLVRNGREFGMPTWIRVTIGTEEQNKKVLAILERTLGLKENTYE